MTPAATYSYSRPRMGWFRRSENWLDEKGKGAWIAAMVLGFVFFWPIGLALLFYMLWSKRMFAQSCGHRRNRSSRRHGADFSFDIRTRHGTGNVAFDAYKEETLRRLEEEQEQFETFLQRLRAAKDKAEFDQFMDDRTRQAADDHADHDDDRGDDDDTTELREPKRS